MVSSMRRHFTVLQAHNWNVLITLCIQFTECIYIYICTLNLPIWLLLNGLTSIGNTSAMKTENIGWKEKIQHNRETEYKIKKRCLQQIINKLKKYSIKREKE